MYRIDEKYVLKMDHIAHKMRVKKNRDCVRLLNETMKVCCRVVDSNSTVFSSLLAGLFVAHELAGATAAPAAAMAAAAACDAYATVWHRLNREENCECMRVCSCAREQRRKSIIILCGDDGDDGDGGGECMTHADWRHKEYKLQTIVITFV